MGTRDGAAEGEQKREKKQMKREKQWGGGEIRAGDAPNYFNCM